MPLLALDTALGATQAAVLDGGRVVASEARAMTSGHAETLMPMAERVLAAAGIGYAAVQRIVVTIGPGTFTGVRIGLAAARALGLALRRPVLGVTTLAALAEGLGEVTAAIDARRGEAYLQRFSASGSPLGAPRVVALGEAAAMLPAGARLVGSAAPLIAERRADLVALAAPQAPEIAAIARLGAAMTPPTIPPAPLYLRAPDAKPQPPPLPRRP